MPVRVSGYWPMAAMYRFGVKRMYSVVPPPRRRTLTVGLNDGPAAGQTVTHAHVHLIPRHRR